MNNDPELNGKYLGSISQDFVKVAKVLQEAAYQVRKRNISNFPIFPISQEELPIGQLLVGTGEAPAPQKWNFYLSFLQEFLDRELINREDEFTEAYKDPDEFCCLFVVDVPGEFTNFVFIPYPLEDA